MKKFAICLLAVSVSCFAWEQDYKIHPSCTIAHKNDHIRISCCGTNMSLRTCIHANDKEACTNMSQRKFERKLNGIKWRVLDMFCHTNSPFFS